MLFLNKKSISEIDKDIIQDAVKEAYRLVLSADYNMPDRTHAPDGENTVLFMPCFEKQFFGVKLVWVFPKAPQQGYPAVNGIMVLSDNITGQPLAIMDGAALTAQRTGAVGGLAIDMLSSDSVNSAGIFGAGVQGFHQGLYLLHNRSIDVLYIHDLNRKSAEKMAGNLSREFKDVDCIIADSPEQVIKNCEIIIAATTSSTPLFEISKDDAEGRLFISIGSFRPDMQEFPDTVTANADEIFVDTMFAAEESGDIAGPVKRNIIKSTMIKEFAGLIDKNNSFSGKTVFFKTVGMALFDLSVACSIYKMALKDGIGQSVEF